MGETSTSEINARKKNKWTAIIAIIVTSLMIMGIVIFSVLTLRKCEPNYEKEIRITNNLNSICNKGVKENKGLDYKIAHISCVKYASGYLHVTTYIEELQSVADFSIEVQGNDINTILDNIETSADYNVYSILLYPKIAHNIDDSAAFINIFGNSYNGDSGEDDTHFVFHGIGHENNDYLVMYDYSTEFLDNLPVGYSPLTVSDNASTYYNLLSYLYKIFK